MKDCTEIILGPPGTGKTHTLLEILDGLLSSNKVQPHEVCFVSFTKRAADEALERCLLKFVASRDEFKWIRTLHSLAFQFHHIQTTDVMTWSNYLEIANMLGLTITSQRVEEGSYGSTTTRGDRLLFMENLARVTGKSLQDIWEKFINDDMSLPELELMAKTIAQYKHIRGKLDFTDMIVRFNETGQTPNIRALIVDEAQDLSPIQWRMVELLAERTEYFYVAGDDDQAIYSWAGADVETFINLGGPKRVLHQSYRVPRSIHAIADRVVRRIKHRNDKEYAPRDFEGRVEHHSDLSTIDMSQGSWLLLSRNLAYLPEMAEHCLSKGHLFKCKHGSPISTTESRAIVFWERLRKGQKISAAEVKNIYELMSVRVGFKYGFKKKVLELDDKQMMTLEELCIGFGLLTREMWRIAFDRMPGTHIQYFINALKSGEKLSVEPRIKIDTIHAVKGGEADNVVLVTDVTRRTFEEFQRNPDDEYRTWYVGITRAKESLYILHPTGPYFHEL